MDFLLKEHQIVVEVKKTRRNLGPKEVGEQLIIDIAKYRNHPDCRTLVCFVYDPDHRIGNPHGLKTDLESQSTDDMQVVVHISSCPASLSDRQPSQDPKRSDEARELFRIISGCWHLDYQEGEEELVVDEHGRGFRKEDRALWCTYENVQWNPELREIHWLKVRAPTRRGKSHEETLILSEDHRTMQGHRDHDRVRLIYTRIAD